MIGETASIPLIHVFGRELDPAFVTRLLLLQRVIYQDLDLCFPDLTITSLDGEILANAKDWARGELFRCALLERLLSDYDNAVLLLDTPADFDLEEQLRQHDHLELVRRGKAVCKASKNLESLLLEPKIVDVSEIELARGSFCISLMRADLPQWVHLHNLPSLHFKDSIVLGVPTTSRRTHIMNQHPLLTILLPSLHDTCKSNPVQLFTLLVAYDHGDKYLDHQQDQFKALLLSNKPANLEIVMVKIPFLGSVTMLWNIMYEISIKQGAKYFYQLNDDIKFHSHDWPTVFTEWIDGNRGFGLTGPCDEAFPNCSLMTQNFVGRGHYEIFTFLFPPDLQNWWSDDWLNRVYECVGMKKCFAGIRISNGNRRDGENPRYQACPYLPSHELLVSHYCEAAKAKLKAPN